MKEYDGMSVSLDATASGENRSISDRYVILDIQARRSTIYGESVLYVEFVARLKNLTLRIPRL